MIWCTIPKFCDMTFIVSSTFFACPCLGVSESKEFAESTRRRAYGLVAQAYTSISAEDFAAFVGYSVEEAVKGVVSHGWQADPNTRMIMPQKPDPPPVSLVPNEQQLARLTDYVAFLEN
ncbi:COP9 signalosome complex subunit 8 [Labeo rohita]|uniref:COP9 signalosome complex subunit 8 n=1 Tax=Labeo rohita TaxID=84645 RepID=A0A498NEP6_LABRO|nr:COP9 signalosome complex subunit 8 [Labeo rohita]